MPDIKHNFTGGKMNKDVDERLVPNGQYRDAMNVQVSTSEGSDVGTIQNILGNIEGCTYDNNNPNPIPIGSTTVGSVSDEKNDTLYWLIAGQPFLQGNLCDAIDNGDITLPISTQDMIMRKTSSGCEPVFVDKYSVLIENTDVGSDSSNTIVIDVNSLLDITVGMTVTGVDSTGCIFSDPLIVESIGPLTMIPMNYYFNYDVIPETFAGGIVNWDDAGTDASAFQGYFEAFPAADRTAASGGLQEGILKHFQLQTVEMRENLEDGRPSH